MKKTTFFREGPENEPIPHLHIVISDPNENGEVMVVNISSCKERYERSCVLEAGEHPQITKKSYIPYKYAKKMNQKIFLTDRFRRLITVKEDISDSVLKKIQEGAKISPRLESGFKSYFNFF